MIDYLKYIDRKISDGINDGFEPSFILDSAFDFQKHLISWNVKKGRSALFSDCGTGKSLMELSWAENIKRETNGNVLILTPLAVGFQMEKEANKFGIEQLDMFDAV